MTGVKAVGVLGMALAFMSVVAVLPREAHADKLNVGREASAAEIAGWSTAVRPDGKGLPVGKGTAAKGEQVFIDNCASCHGDFGEGKDKWPVLAGGLGSLSHDRPDKTIGSYWPYASTVFDYIKRAMPFGNPHALSDDDVYALTAYLLHVNDVIKDTNFELNQGNLASIKMPNAGGFYDDDREKAEAAFWKSKPCMKDCRKDTPTVLNRAREVDVTPEKNAGPKVD